MGISVETLVGWSDIINKKCDENNDYNDNDNDNNDWDKELTKYK